MARAYSITKEGTAIADNVAITAGSGTNIATDDIGGVQHQRVKVEFGADGSATDVSAAAPMPSGLYAVADGGFSPEPSSREPDASYGAVLPVRLSSGGEVVTRSAVSTDEGHFRHDFPGAALTTAISGTNATFTNGSATVTGSGTAFTTQIFRGMYIKLNADAETAWAQVQSVESDTSLTLAATYAGTGGTGASSFSNFKPFNAAGVTVASSIASLASGTTISQRTSVWRLIDWAPLRLTVHGFSVSQRIVNQTGYLGFQDAETSPTNYARFEITGTTNTVVNCVVSNDGGTTTSTSTATLPNTGTTTTSGTTATAASFEIELTRERVVFLIDRQVVANFERHIPMPYATLGFFAGWVNAGSAPASTTTMTVDEVFIRNTSIVQMARDFVGDPIPVEVRPGADMLVQATNVVMTATNNVAVLELAGRAASLAIELSGTFTGTVTFEILMADQGVWTAHNVTVPSTGASVTTATAVGRWWASVPGAKAFRVRSSTAGTGSVNVSMLASAASTPVTILGVGTSAIGSVSVSATTALTPGTAAANLGKAEDAVAASGDTGVFVLSIRRDTPATNVSAAGDYAEFAVDALNQLWVHPAQASFTLAADSAGLTTSVTAYTSGDTLGTEITFANAATVSGWGGIISKAILVDKSLKVYTGDVEAWIFSAASTPAADNAAADWSDANIVNLQTIITFSTSGWKANTSNAVNVQQDLSRQYTCAATSLFAVLVTRQANTFFSAVTDLRLILGVLRD